MKNTNGEEMKKVIHLFLKADEELKKANRLNDILNSTDTAYKRSIYKHDRLFILLLNRFISTFKYWYLRKDFVLEDDKLYFKFSNVTMYNIKFLPNDEMKAITKKQLTFLIDNKVIIRKFFDIKDDKVSTFYSVDFVRLINYFIDFYKGLLENPDIDVKKLKQNLKYVKTIK